jgi:hypothetical protein
VTVVPRTCPCSIWNNTVTPGFVAPAGQSIEVGLKFRSDLNGVIDGVRFYKGSGNTGTHVGKLYTLGGTLLAQATFSGESASGWQQVSFATPVQIQANTTYVASYVAPNGAYAFDVWAFYSAGVTNAPLRALSGAEAGGNGVFSQFPSGFPFDTYQSTNYWVDVVFRPDTTPPTISTVQATNLTPVSATISWTTNEASDTQVQYGPTTSYGSQSALNTAMVTSHSQGLTGLTANTLYHYRVKSRDANGNLATSADLTFTTPPPDTTPPTISAVSATGITFTTATISWTTNEASNTQVQYGPTTAYGSQTTVNAAMVTSHSQGLIGLTSGQLYHYRVKSRDASGNLATSGDSTFTAQSCPCSLWSPTATPAVANESDTSAVQVGVKFRSSTAGQIAGIRFYKGNLNTGTHVGQLYSATGTLLAQATFTNETASGWQQVNFPTPVSIAANTTYVASYHAPVGRYSVTGAYFNSALTNGPLTALANATEAPGNGLYRYTSTPAFPNAGYNAENYWVDVVLTVGPPDTTPPTISAVAATGVTAVGATISWTTNEASDTQVEYGPTTSYGSSTTVVAAPVTAHSQAIAGLTANTLYHYRVKSRDGAGNLATSADFTFTTAPDTTPPTISGVSATGITAAGATISWTTNEVSDTQVQYGPTTAYGSSTTLAPAPVTSHSQALTGLTAGTLYHYRVKSRDAAGNLATSADFTFTTATPSGCPCSLWSAATTPATPNENDTSAVQVGVKFRANQAGRITGIRFYKGPLNTGTHVGQLHTAAGVLLAQATFTNETASGWQQVNFATPVSIAANTTYVASYHAPVGRYATNGDYFAAATTNGPLTALASGTETPGNGLYRYTATPAFPDSTYNNENYWVDVVFTP